MLPTDAMSALITAVRLLAASQVLLLACALATAGSTVRPRAAGITLAICVICYLLIPLLAPFVGAAVALPAFLANAIPPVLLWFTWEVFEDTQRPPKSFIIAGLAYLAAVAAIWPSVGEIEPPLLLAGAVQLSKLGFAMAAVAIVWRGRHADLVERRLRMRRVFAAGIAMMVAAVVVAELVTAWDVPLDLELMGMAAIFALALGMNLAFLRPAPMLLEPPKVPPRANVEAEDPLLVELLRAMRDERLYADHDLRIRSLASRLGVPEHRLRRAINRQLGHRNFNQFVNGYRIEEAARRLRSDRHLPILTIALDVGFRSVSSFNSAFRAHFGVAPSEFRAGDTTRN
jgi:AraC-like DNA-binding protein